MNKQCLLPMSSFGPGDVRSPVQLATWSTFYDFAAIVLRVCQAVASGGPRSGSGSLSLFRASAV